MCVTWSLVYLFIPYTNRSVSPQAELELTLDHAVGGVTASRGTAVSVEQPWHHSWDMEFTRSQIKCTSHCWGGDLMHCDCLWMYVPQQKPMSEGGGGQQSWQGLTRCEIVWSHRDVLIGRSHSLAAKQGVGVWLWSWHMCTVHSLAAYNKHPHTHPPPSMFKPIATCEKGVQGVGTLPSP